MAKRKFAILALLSFVAAAWILRTDAANCVAGDGGHAMIALDFDFPEDSESRGDSRAELSGNAIGGVQSGKAWEIVLHSYDGGGPAYEVACSPEGIVRCKLSVSVTREGNGEPVEGAKRWHTYRFFPVKPGVADVVIYTWLDRGADAKMDKRVFRQFKLVVADDMTVKAVPENGGGR